jgi:hypothetical protein
MNAPKLYNKIYFQKKYKKLQSNLIINARYGLN